ncbi:hypothetical protein GE061_000584 [Apolygus lucorum]|uniref:Uncharacterized protein n=1 Tax=Apolygus lucorum TaxID=248454 RepID=A0A6A4KB40_APOLU|nr:hypothetical protein GE061_000584 [Apolygus lucorum]
MSEEVGQYLLAWGMHQKTIDLLIAAGLESVADIVHATPSIVVNLDGIPPLQALIYKKKWQESFGEESVEKLSQPSLLSPPALFYPEVQHSVDEPDPRPPSGIASYSNVGLKKKVFELVKEASKGHGTKKLLLQKLESLDNTSVADLPVPSTLFLEKEKWFLSRTVINYLLGLQDSSKTAKPRLAYSDIRPYAQICADLFGDTSQYWFDNAVLKVEADYQARYPSNTDGDFYSKCCIVYGTVVSLLESADIERRPPFLDLMKHAVDESDKVKLLLLSLPYATYSRSVTKSTSSTSHVKPISSQAVIATWLVIVEDEIALEAYHLTLKQRGDGVVQPYVIAVGKDSLSLERVQLSNVRSFTTHVHKYHKGAVPPSPSSPACRHTPDRTPVLRSLEDERTPVKANAPPPPPLPPSAVPSVKTMSDEAACAYMCTIGSTFIADFHRNTAATNKSIQQAVVFTRKTMEEMAGVLDHLHDDYVTRKCGGENCDHMKEFVALAQQVMTNWMKPLSTVHKRWNYFVESGALIPPEIVTLNTRKVVCGDEVPELIKDMSGQYVSITKTLKNVLELPGLLDEINDYKAYCEDQTGIFNICQGSAWLNGVSNAPDCLTLPVNIYFDDFETGNPLGSHSGGANKLGAVYMTLPFLPPRLQSKLDFIFLVMIFSSMDRREKGQDADNYRIFKWVILELNELGRVGIELNLPGRKTVIKFALGCLVGDNLGLNDILGFTTSFSAIRCCRLCRATKNQFSQLTVEDESLMRNSVNYQQDYEKWEKGETDTGIVGDNVWEKLDNFSIDNKVSVDLMHDMYEGVARYTMQVVLKGLIAKNSRFTLEYLNSRIKNLRYGPDRYSKPTQIGPSKKRGGNFNIRMSASEMRNFVAYFGLLVGHKVDPYDPDYRTPTAPPPAKKRRLKEKDDDSSSYFHLYNLMCAILRIITSDRVVDEEVRRLQLLIKDFLMLYMKLSNRLTSLVAHSSGVHVTEDGDGDDSDSEFLEGSQ